MDPFAMRVFVVIRRLLCHYGHISNPIELMLVVNRAREDFRLQ